MLSALRSKVLVACVLLAIGCAHGSGATNTSLAEVERVRASAGAREGQELAPQQYARAEEQRAFARKAADDGDHAAASLYAERALAAYQHALVLARLARATEDATSATAALQAADEQAQRLASSRADVEREANEAEKKLQIARERILPVPTRPADPAREAARLVAARSLAMQGRLLCGAARLLNPSIPTLAQADKDVSDLETLLANAPKSAPIDAAARARASCLTLLTGARRSLEGTHGSDADALLAELSASGGWAPSRDERGVVVVLRSAFKGNALDPDADKKLRELGRVAAAHPTFAVQVVLHDAAPPPTGTSDAPRTDAAVAALVAGGALATRVKAETAGADAPIVDPADTRHRGRNARLEVVFVAP